MNSGGQAHRTARSLRVFLLLSSSSFLPTHSPWDLFYASNLQSATLVQNASFFSASSNFGQDKLADVCSRSVESLSLMLNLCTSYEQISKFREFIVTLFFFSFCILDFFLSYALIIIKIITQQKKMAGKIWHAVTEGRTHTLEKNMTGCSHKHRLNFQNMTLSRKVLKGCFCLFVCFFKLV